MRELAIRNEQLGNSLGGKTLVASYCLLVPSSVDRLVKSSAKLGISSGFAHSVVFTHFLAVFKSGLCAQLLRSLYAVFHTAKKPIFSLLRYGFSTSSTGLITEATNLNKLLMETV